MAITIDWLNRIIHVPIADLTLISSSPKILRSMDLNWFRTQLKILEESESGIVNPDTHIHYTKIDLSGTTYARTIKIINGYTVTFENDHYAIEIYGANSNISDVTNVNDVSIRTANSAGLISISTGSGLSNEEHNKLMNIPQETENAEAVWRYER